MNSLIRKSALVVLFILIVTLILPMNKIFAVSQNVAIINDEEDYIIYIEGLEKKAFKFAFSNESVADDSLDFTANWEDTNDINIACLEKNSKIDFSKAIFLIIKEGEGEKATYSSIKLNLSNAITKEEMANVEKLTKKISIKISKSKPISREENGVKKTETVDQIEITDDKDCKYKYELIKLDGNEKESIKQFMGLVNTLNDSYKTMSMYNKVLVATGIKDLYKDLYKNAKLINVENMIIFEPQDAIEGDRYLALIQKEKDGKIITNDIQFLTCTNGEEKEIVKETKVVKETSILPVTYDSIVLIIMLAVILIIIIAIVLRMRNLNAKENNK